jgi:uncharacterized protein Usg
MNTHDLARQLAGWRQTTAEILYRMPDYPALVQTYVWQDLDRWHDDPRLTYPRLRRFCEWWNPNLDGPIVQGSPVFEGHPKQTDPAGELWRDLSRNRQFRGRWCCIAAHE